MSKGVGSGGISTDGLVFCVDAFNQKCYMPPIGTPTTSNVTSASYSGFVLNRVYDSSLQPNTISISGNVVSTWNGYINSGSLSLLLGGGAIDEVYTVNNAIYDTYNNVTALYPNPVGFVTMSYPCSISAAYGANWIKISGENKSDIFNIYLTNQSPLVFSLTGSIGVSVATASGASYSGFANNKSVISVPGYVAPFWDGLLSINGGTLSVSLSGGATPEVYDVNNSFYDGDVNVTVLYPDLSLSNVLMTQTCSITTDYGPPLVKIENINLAGVFNIYFTSTPSYVFGLTGGAIPESYTVSNTFFTGTDTIIYDSNFIGTSYTDHTEFSVMVPDITSTLYTDNTIFTYSVSTYPESYSVNSAFFDGTDTYLYDSVIGTTYSGHTEFIVRVPQVMGTLYTDHTNATFSYIDITPQTASYDLSKNLHYCPLYNGVGFDGRSFTFDGVDDYIDVGELGYSFSSFSLDMWFNSGSVTDYKNLIDFNGFNVCLRIEQYTFPGYVAAWRNLGGPTGRARMSININGSGDGFGVGGDCPGDVVQGEWYNLIVSYSGTGTVSIPLTVANEFDGFVMTRTDTGYPTLYTMMISGNVEAQWNNWITQAGGVLSADAIESSGTYSDVYPITGAYFQSGYTHLVPAANQYIGLTMLNSGYIDDVQFGFNVIRLGGSGSNFRWDKIYEEVFSVWPALTMSLVSGTYSQQYVVDSTTYISPYTYVYDSANIGATMMYPNTFSQYESLMPKIGLDVQLGTFSGYDRISASGPSASVCSMYINGETFLDQWAVAGGFVGYIANMRIGDGYDYSSRRFQGKIPFVGIYDRPVTKEEALTNYEELKWRFNI